jgi:hypothetical protein
MKNPDKSVLPRRCFGFLSMGQLIVNMRDGRPRMLPSRQAAEKELDDCPPWIKPTVSIVGVEVHEVPGQHPTYVIDNRSLS